MAETSPPDLFDPDVGSEAEARAAFLLRLRARGVRDIAVLRAMEAVPRTLFVAPRYAGFAARDIALPTGCGQTMAEPAFVAGVLQVLGCSSHHRVLEVGTGSGYVTALLSRLAADVVSLERFRILAEEAAARLEGLEVRNAAVHWADGLADHPGLGGFDRMLLLASVDCLPPHLLARLAPGGRLVYVAASTDQEGIASQTLVVVTAEQEGEFRHHAIGPARLQAAYAGRSAFL